MGKSFLQGDSLPARPNESSAPSENNFAKLGARTQHDARAENARVREKSDDCPRGVIAERTRPLPRLEDTFRRPKAPLAQVQPSGGRSTVRNRATEGS